MATFHNFSEGDPAYDLVAVIEHLQKPSGEMKVYTGEEAKKDLSPLAQLVADGKYQQVLEKGFFGNVDIILAGKESELDAVFSLALSLLKHVDDEVVGSFLTRFSDCLTKTTDKATTKLQLLSVLFNVLDAGSPIRHTIFVSILKFANASGNPQLVITQFHRVDDWCKEWKLNAAQITEINHIMYETSFLISKDHKEPTTQKYLLAYLSSLDSLEGKAVQSATKEAAFAVVTAISNPTIIQYESLFNLKAVQALSTSTAEHKVLFKLLSIFTNDSIKEYNALVKASSKVITQQGLDLDVCLDKIRLLAICDLAQGQKEVSFAQLMDTLEVKEVTLMEEIVINAIQSGGIDAKIDQENQVALIRRVTQRKFADVSWREINKTLTNWISNISSVLSHLPQHQDY